MKIAKHNPRGDEDLGLAMVGAVLEVGVVRLHVRPKFLGNVVLERIVPDKSPANLSLVGGRKRSAEGSLNVEPSKALPVRDGRRKNRLQGPILVLACGQGGLEEGSQDVVAMLFICGGDPVFDEKTPVAEPVLQRGILVSNVGRWSDQKNLDMPLRDEFDALISVVVYRR